MILVISSAAVQVESYYLVFIVRLQPRSTRRDTLVPYTTRSLSLVPIGSTGRFGLRGLPLATAWRFVQEDVALAEPAGGVDADVRYQLAYRDGAARSEEHTSELQSLMRNSYAVFCLKKKTYNIFYQLYKSSLLHCNQTTT